MADRTVKASGGVSSLAGTYVEGILPTSADRIVLNSSSGQFTVDATLACRSIDCTGYTNILTHNSGIAINIGDATSAVGNLALKFVNGMIYNRLNPATCAINFISTNATQQQVEFGGNTFGNITFKGAGSSYIFNDDLVCQKYYATLDVQQGTVNTNSKTVTAMIFTETTGGTKTITLGASVINCYPAVSDCFSWANATGLTITANTAIVNVYRSPTNTNGATFIRVPTSMSNYLTLNVYGGGIVTFASGNSTAYYKKVSVYGAPALFGIDDRMQMNQNVAVTDSINIYGYSAERRLRVHNGGDFYLPNATALYCQYTDFQSVNIPTYTVDVSAMLGGSGDLGGNSNMIFSTGITCYWRQTVAGIRSWSDSSNWFLGSAGAGGQARSPLPQDTARFDSASFTVAGCVVGGVTSQFGTFRLGKHIDWTGVTNFPTWDFPCDATNYGSFTLSPNMYITTYSEANSSLLFGGSNNVGETFTVDFAGLTMPFGGVFVNMTALDTCIFQSDFIGNSSNTTLLQTTALLVNFNNKNVTTGRFTLGGTTVTLGNGLFKLKGNGTVFNSTATTVSSTTCTIEINSQDNVNKTVAGNGKSYGALKLSGNFNDQITFTGNNTWTNFDNTKTSAHTLLFTAGSTNTFTGAVTKTIGALWTLASTTTSVFTWTKTSGTVTFVDVIISKSTANGGATFTANTNSIDGGGNTGWSGFVTNAYTWTNGGATGLASTSGNWFGGVLPTSSDIIYFTGGFNSNCSLNLAYNNFSGVVISSSYTGVITLANDFNCASSIFEINGGTFTCGNFNSTFVKGFKQTGGTFNATSNVAYMTVYGLGSTASTVSITGGTFTHNSGEVILTGSLDAIINNGSTRQFNKFSTLSFTGKLSGTFFIDTLTSLNSQEFNGDISVKGGFSSGTLTGTGTVRLIGTTVALNSVSVYNLQFNCTGVVTLSADCIVNNTLTLTAVPTVNGNTIRCKGSISSSVTTISGTTNTSIEGTLAEQSLSGAGVFIGNVTVNKTSGLVKQTSNLQPCDTGKNFTITKGQFNTNNFNILLSNNVTVTESTGGVFYFTELSKVQINGTLTGRKIARQRLYANGLR